MHIEVGMIVPGRAGGIHVTESALVSELRQQPGVTVNVFQFGSRAETESGVERLLGRARDLLSYNRSISRQHPDIVLIHSSFNRRGLIRDLGYALVSRLRRVALVIKFHGCDPSVLSASDGRMWRLVTSLIFRWCQSLIVLSREELEALQAAGFNSAKLRVMKNALDITRFTESAPAKFDPPAILFIARFIAEKGLLDTIRAARLLTDEKRSFILYCVGDGPIRDEAEELVRELNLTTHVHFVGRISEKEAEDYYLRSTVLAFPSYFQEGLPMAILQAAAAGLPIVSSRVRAVGEYLTEPANALWVKPRDPEMLAERICEIFDSIELRESMAAQNRQLSHSFSAITVAEDYMALFNEISTAGRGTRGLSR